MESTLHQQRKKKHFDIWLIFGSYFFGSIPSFMLPTLTNLLLAQNGIKPSIIGLYAATSFILILITTPIVSPIVQYVGERWALIGATSMALVCIIGYMLTDYLFAWFIFQGVWGFTLSIRWIVSESWAIELAPPSQRGRFVGLLQTALGAATFVGPSLLLITGTNSILPFATTFGLLFLGLLLLFPVKPPIKQNTEVASPSPNNPMRPIIQAIPYLIIAVLIGGVFEVGTTAILPIYGVSVGLNTSSAASLVTAIGLGSFLLQYPLGYLADYIDINTTIIGSVVVMFIASILLLFTEDSNLLLWVLAFIWGGVGGGLYTLAIIALGKRFTGAHLLQATSVLVFTYTLGSTIGPILGGLALDISTNYGLVILFSGISILGILGLTTMAQLQKKC